MHMQKRSCCSPKDRFLENPDRPADPRPIRYMYKNNTRD